jgi:hypothetical protein
MQAQQLQNQTSLQGIQSQLYQAQVAKLNAEQEAERRRQEALGRVGQYFNQPQPQVGVSDKSAQAIGAPWAAASTLPQPQGPGQIPPQELLNLYSAGVDVGPLMNINKSMQPETEQVDAGNEILIRDKRTGQVMQRVPKQGAPSALPFWLQRGPGGQSTIDQVAFGGAKDLKKAGATTVTQTVGGKEVDKKFAADHVAFATGGYADLVKQVGQLQEVSKALETEEGLTGPVVGNIPRGVRNVSNPRSVAVMEAVEEVVQRNLRLVLGAQFTEKEGERLISRAYNPVLPQAENKKRVDRLIKQIQSAAEAKLDASRYFMANGTLEGWKGKTWTMKDFNPEADVAPKKAPAQTRQPPQDAIRRLKMNPKERAQFDEVFGEGAAARVLGK